MDVLWTWCEQSAGSSMLNSTLPTVVCASSTPATHDGAQLLAPGATANGGVRASNGQDRSAT